MTGSNQDIFLAYNARIWSGDATKDNTWMTFNIKSGYILDVGRNDPPSWENFPEDHRKDYQGRRIFPGFHESHVHLGLTGEQLMNLDLKGCSSIQELKEKLKSWCEKYPEKRWIVGNNWEQDFLGRYPDRLDLDEVCQDRPVFLWRACLHIAVVNSKALELGGIDQDTPDPIGGSIDHYPADHPQAGEPSGVLRENACTLLKPFYKPTSEDVVLMIQEAVQEALRNGVTSAHSCEEFSWNEFSELWDRGQLPIRIFYSAFYTQKDKGNFPRAGQKHGEHLSCDRIKIFSDGALGAGTAYLSLPYVGKTDRGIPIQSQEDLLAQVKEATGAGYRLEIHAIGDAAAESVIQALEDAKVAPEKRPILTHCQILRPDLLPRMKALGIVANIQPQFVPTDARWLHTFLPQQLMDCVYPWKTLFKHGILCAGGSDAPVEAVAPMHAIYDAIFRPSGRDEAGRNTPFKPEECLSLTEAIDLYTKNGAYATLEEHRLGQLLPGFLADYVVLEAPRDVCEEPRLFMEAKVLEVWVGGKKKL